MAAKYVVPFAFATSVLVGVACATGTVAVAPEPSEIQASQDAGSDVDSVPSKPLPYKISGTLAGLTGKGLVLQNNGADDLAVNANGAFSFNTGVPTGKPFSVTIKTQPSEPSQTCTVANGSGTIAGADVTVVVTCVDNTFSVGGTVSGLVGTGLVLQNNAGGDLPVASNGAFTFPALQADGTPFAVSVKTNPANPDQECFIAGGTGTVAGGNVTSVNVNCSKTKFAIGGTISGLSGTGLVLQNNGGDDLTLNANGTFAFATPLDDLVSYAVTVKTQPTNKWQTCVVTNGSGNVAGGPVSGISITCTTNTYKVKGTVSGLEGSGLVLQNNGANNLVITNNGAFEFVQPLASGSAYLVSTLTNPSNPTQTCTASNGSGTIAGTDTNVLVTCVTNKYSVGGTISGLTAGSVILTNNGGSDLTLGANGSFSFGTTIASGSAYAVAVKTQPADRECVVTSGTGTVGNAAVTTVKVTCGHTGCRVVNNQLWCKDTVAARSCNAFCTAIGLANPSISDAEWTAAQDTAGECAAIASAFGLGNANVGAYTYACAELRDSDFACSTNTSCPSAHRTGSDVGSHWAVCPCGTPRVCVTAEEEPGPQSAKVTCPNGSVIQSIEYASFGLPTGACGSFTNGACHAATSKAVVEASCLGKASCTVPATVQNFGPDPCINQNKRLYIQATCQ